VRRRTPRKGRSASRGLRSSCYASLCLLIVTAKGTDWPLVLFWIGVALAVVAGVQYVLRARREVASPR